jgi:hypothetical protein
LEFAIPNSFGSHEPKMMSPSFLNLVILNLKMDRGETRGKKKDKKKKRKEFPYRHGGFMRTVCAGNK